MNTTILIQDTAKNTGLTKAQTEATLKAVFQIIRENVAAGNTVRLFEFGTFQACWRSARQGRNIETGDTIDIPAARVAKFSPAELFKEAVNK